MRMNVREFRERLYEVVLGDEPVVVMRGGRMLGRFVPERATASCGTDLRSWIDARQRFAERWRAETPDWADRLASYGLDEDGEPLQNEAGC